MNQSWSMTLNFGNQRSLKYFVGCDCGSMTLPLGIFSCTRQGPCSEPAALVMQLQSTGYLQSPVIALSLLSPHWFLLVLCNMFTGPRVSRHGPDCNGANNFSSLQTDFFLLCPHSSCKFPDITIMMAILLCWPHHYQWFNNWPGCCWSNLFRAAMYFSKLPGKRFRKNTLEQFCEPSNRSAAIWCFRLQNYLKEVELISVMTVS